MIVHLFLLLSGVVKALFTPRISLPPLCRGLGGLEGGSQRSLQRNGIIRKTLSGGMAAMRRHSQCISVKLQAVSKTIYTLPVGHCVCGVGLGLGGLACLSHCRPSLQDALVNLIRRARPVFLQCVYAKSDGGNFDVPTLRVQLRSTQILWALQFHRAGVTSGFITVCDGAVRLCKSVASSTPATLSRVI